MQINIELVTLGLILANFLVSVQGFSNLELRSKWVFRVDAILLGREYHRLISGGFLHSGWPHLIFNMLTLYFFSSPLNQMALPSWYFLLIYFGSLLGGHLVALFLHRNHGDYAALGASGAVNGVIFAAIALAPGISVWFIPGWLFGILYLAGTIYGIRAQVGRISHEAHLGGAIFGILAAILFRPTILVSHPLLLAALLIPAGVFLYLVYTRPEMLMIPGYFKGEALKVKETIGKSNASKPKNDKFSSPEEEINHLLDKGLENLSNKERKRLEELSRSLKE